jgi:Tfp pilus assembly protein PilN
MDLKKEIKLSDLFRRKPKAQAEAEAEPAAEQAPAKRRRLFARGKDGEPKEPRAKKQKQPREKRARRGSGQSLPSTPLMRAFNLMPKEVTGGAESRRANPVQLALAVAALVVFAVLASMFLITNARVADKEQELNTLKSRLAALNVPAEKPVPQGADPALIQERDARSAALGTALATRLQWDRLLRDLSLVLPEDAWLTTLVSSGGGPGAATAEGAPPAEGTQSPSTVELNGFARTPEAVAELLRRVEVLAEVESAQLVNATTTTLAGKELIQFTISATLKQPSGGASA